jgi:hypothetical protein
MVYEQNYLMWMYYSQNESGLTIAIAHLLKIRNHHLFCINNKHINGDSDPRLLEEVGDLVIQLFN